MYTRRRNGNIKFTQSVSMEMKPNNMVLREYLFNPKCSLEQKLSQFGARGLKLKTERDNKLNAPVSKTRARHATDNALVAH